MLGGPLLPGKGTAWLGARSTERGGAAAEGTIGSEARTGRGHGSCHSWTVASMAGELNVDLVMGHSAPGPLSLPPSPLQRGYRQDSRGGAWGDQEPQGRDLLCGAAPTCPVCSAPLRGLHRTPSCAQPSPSLPKTLITTPTPSPTGTPQSPPVVIPRSDSSLVHPSVRPAIHPCTPRGKGLGSSPPRTNPDSPAGASTPLPGRWPLQR